VEEDHGHHQVTAQRGHLVEETISMTKVKGLEESQAIVGKEDGTRDPRESQRKTLLGARTPGKDLQGRVTLL